MEIWLSHACAMHLVIIIGTVHSLWTSLWGRYHVQQNAFLVNLMRLKNHRDCVSVDV